VAGELGDLLYVGLLVLSARLRTCMSSSMRCRSGVIDGLLCEEVGERNSVSNPTMLPQRRSGRKGVYEGTEGKLVSPYRAAV